MDIFKLIGSIFIKNQDANQQLDETTNHAKKTASEIGKAVSDAGEKMTSIGKKLAPVSLAFSTLFTASVVGASKFTDGMAKMSTLFDTTQTSVGDLSKEFLDLSSKMGLSATELAEAGYQALSAGIDVDKSVGFVETAGRLAKAGFTSTATAVDVLTTAINAYGLSADEAEALSNKLVRTQNLGKTTVDELASSMGKIIPTASSMNVSIDNLTAGYVGLTKQGIATAESTTYMNSMLNELGDSGTTVGGILKDRTGKSFQELMADGNSLADVLKILQDDAKESGTNFNELWGSAEAGKAGIALLNGGVDEFNQTVETMASKTDDVSEAIEKLNTPSAKAHKALNRVKNSGIELGTAFLTSLTPVIDSLASGVEKLTTWFSGLDDRTKTIIATVIGFLAVASPVLIVGGKIVSGVGKVIPLVSKLGTVVKTASTVLKYLWAVMEMNPIIAVIAIIATLVTGFITLWNKSEAFRNFWIGLWNGIKSVCSNAINGIKTAFDAVKSAGQSVLNKFNEIKEGIKNKINGARDAVQSAISRIKGFFNFSWSLPKLKLPHFSASGKFSLNPLSVPHFSISWYKKAMDEPYMFTKPTLFDVNPMTGQARGAGEAGDEMMYGKQNLMNDIREAVSNENSDLFNILSRILDFMTEYFPMFASMQMVTDTGALVGEIAPKMDTALGGVYKKKKRGV